MGKTIKIAIWFANVFFGLTFLLMSYFMSAFLGMLGPTKLQFTVMQSLPNLIVLLVMLVFIISSIVFYYKQEYKISFVLSVLPIVNVIVFVILLFKAAS